MPGMQTRFRMEQGHLVRERTQPERRAILEHVQQRRNDGNVPDKSEALGRPALTIPELDYWELVQNNPDLHPQNGCTTTQTKAWLKFMRSTASIPYRNFRRI